MKLIKIKTQYGWAWLRPDSVDAITERQAYDPDKNDYVKGSGIHTRSLFVECLVEPDEMASIINGTLQ